MLIKLCVINICDGVIDIDSVQLGWCLGVGVGYVSFFSDLPRNGGELLTRDTILLARKRFHTFKFIRLISHFYFSYLVSLHYNTYKNGLKSATFKIS